MLMIIIVIITLYIFVSTVRGFTWYLASVCLFHLYLVTVHLVTTAHVVNVYITCVWSAGLVVAVEFNCLLSLTRG